MKHIFCALLTVCATFAQELPFPPRATNEQCSFGFDNDNARLDCFPDAFATQEGCETRGCCWKGTTDGHPFCYYPENFSAFQKINDTFLKRVYKSQFPDDVNTVRVDVDTSHQNFVSFKIVDPSNARFVPPYPKLNLNQKKHAGPSPVRVVYESNSLLKLVKDDDPLFTVENANFLFSNQVLQLTFAMKGTLYGVGEHRTRLALDENWTKYTLWNHDNVPATNTNIYGSHPFVLRVDDQGRAFGIYLHNSNAMDVLIQPGPKITFRTIGGNLEFYFFPGPTPADVIQQYVELIGFPAMPPYWGLGFHLCRWGYGSASNLRAVWQRMRDAKIPYDVQWNDIDYMQRNNDFTIDPVNFADLPNFVDDIHAVGMHYVAMLDPGISGSEQEGTYPPYTDAVAMDTLVKDKDGNIFIGHVWNDADTVYPDFFHPRIVEYWTKQLQDFHDKIKFDALWIDMNEPSNFFDGTANGCPDSNLENPPLLPNVFGNKLSTKTLCMTAKHATGTHYDLHNLYGIAEADVTRQAAEKILGKRTFLISRASFAGLGRYSGHWGGDNNSAWSEMVASIVELLTFNMYGVPFMGSDICGFINEPDEELCNRWQQLGAFYPFSRNHNIIGTKDQDPANFGERLIASARKALNVRYSLLPYLYTLFYRSQISGTTVARPLFFEFPDDKIAQKIDTAFLWGSGLYVIPVLEQGATSVNAYLPSGRWFDFYTGSEVRGTDVTLDAPYDTIPLLLRGGSILPSQEPGVTTTESRKNPFSFIVVPDAGGNALGEVFWDDGVSLDTIGNDKYGLVAVFMMGRDLQTQILHWTTDDVPKVSSVKILGVTSAKEVKVDGQVVDFTLDVNNKVLIATLPDIPLNRKFELNWQ